MFTLPKFEAELCVCSLFGAPFLEVYMRFPSCVVGGLPDTHHTHVTPPDADGVVTYHHIHTHRHYYYVAPRSESRSSNMGAEHGHATTHGHEHDITMPNSTLTARGSLRNVELLMQNTSHDQPGLLRVEKGFDERALRDLRWEELPVQPRPHA